MKYSLFLFLTDMHFNALILIKSIIIFSVLKKCDHLEFFPVFAISPKELPVPPPCIILLALFQNFPSFWPRFRTSINLLPLPLSPFLSPPPSYSISIVSRSFHLRVSLSLSLCHFTNRTILFKHHFYHTVPAAGVRSSFHQAVLSPSVKFLPNLTSLHLTFPPASSKWIRCRVQTSRLTESHLVI